MSESNVKFMEEAGTKVTRLLQTGEQSPAEAVKWFRKASDTESAFWYGKAENGND